MAITITQKPNEKVIPAYKDIMFVLSNGAISNYYHKYVIKVTKGTTLLAELKVVANNSNDGVINISKVVQDYCRTDIDGYDLAGTTTYNSTFKGVGAHTKQHAVHQIDSYCRNKSNLIKFKIEAYEEYSTTATGVPIQQGSTQLVGEYLIWNAVSQHANGLTFDYTPYILDGATKDALTTLPSTVNRKIRTNDYHTMCVLNGTFTNIDTTTEFSDPDYAQIKFYNSSGTQVGTTQTLANDDTNGGATPSSYTDQSVRGLLYAGVGYQNLVNNTAITVPSGVASYTVQFRSGVSDKSKIYTFEVQDDDCKGYETIRLAYLNSLGTWDYYNFTKKSTRVTTTQRSTFKSNYGTWNDSSYDYNAVDGGAKVYNVNAKEAIEANTDFITEAEATALEDLFVSPQVFMQNADGEFEPVIVTETTYTKQTRANDKVMQYVIGIGKAHDKRIQRL